MGCGASSVNPDDTLDTIRDAIVTGAGTAAFEVVGAGTAKCNGIYVRRGMLHGRPVFKNGDTWLVYSHAAWYIGDKNKLDDDDGDYYKLDDDELHLPTALGWEVCQAGAEPAPSIIPIFEGPAAYAVQGAGTAAANGIYLRDGSHDGSPLYRHERGQLVLVRARTNQYVWMIADKDKLTEEEGDLYKTETTTEYPPTGDADFTVGGDDDVPGEDESLQGRKPAPTLVALAANGVPLQLEWVPVAQQYAPTIGVPVTAAAAVQHQPNFVPMAYTTSTTSTTTVVTAQVIA